MAGKIGIAYEDVITVDSDLWAKFMKYARLEGHHLTVICESPKYHLIDGMDYYGLYQDLHWDELVEVSEYLTAKGQDLYYDEMSRVWRTKDPLIWWQSKARLCYDYGINIFFEDNSNFAPHFGTVPTRIMMFSDKNVKELIKQTAEKLEAVNSWFEDYEDGFSVYQKPFN